MYQRFSVPVRGSPNPLAEEGEDLQLIDCVGMLRFGCLVFESDLKYMHVKK